MSLQRLAIITAVVWTMGALSLGVMFFGDDVASGANAFFRSSHPALSPVAELQRGIVQAALALFGVGGAIVWAAFGLPSLLALITTWFFERQPRTGCGFNPEKATTERHPRTGAPPEHNAAG